MSFGRIEYSVADNRIGAVLFQLFHEGWILIGQHKLYMADPQLPIATKMTDHVLWKFAAPVKVTTPGPDSTIGNIKQYRDRLEFDIWPWATVTITFTGV